MMIERLAGPCTHIGWTPDFVPKDEREQVSLVRESELAQLEAELEGCVYMRRQLEAENELIFKLLSPDTALWLRSKLDALKESG